MSKKDFELAAQHIAEISSCLDVIKKELAEVRRDYYSIAEKRNTFESECLKLKEALAKHCDDYDGICVQCGEWVCGGVNAEEYKCEFCGAKN